jgi:hypothetical protein
MLRGGAKHEYKRQRLAKNRQEDPFRVVVLPVGRSDSY